MPAISGIFALMINSFFFLMKWTIHGFETAFSCLDFFFTVVMFIVMGSAYIT